MNVVCLQDLLCQPRMPAEELYDLDTDPYEIHNLAESSQPENQAALKRLRTVLDRWIQETQDQGRVPEPAGVAAAEGATQKAKSTK